MAKEAVKIELFGENRDGDSIRYTVASGTAIGKGTLLKLSEPRTASAATSGAIFSGIATMDKSGTDFSTSITVWQNGVFDLWASGAITAGDPVALDSALNYVRKLTQTEIGLPTSGAHNIIVGKALETATDNEVINVRINL